MLAAIAADASHSAPFLFSSFTSTFELTVRYFHYDQQAVIIISKHSPLHLMIFAETRRTILRELTLEDADAFFELDSDPEVHRYLGTQPVTSKDQVIEIINYVRQQYIDNRIGRWAVIDKSTNRFIGWSGLKLVKDVINNHSHYYDLGYRLLRSYWGQGLATETALASLAYGFEQLQLNEIIAAVNCKNTASNSVVKKVGFTRCETFFLNELKHNWYTMSNNEWMNKKPSLSIKVY